MKTITFIIISVIATMADPLKKISRTAVLLFLMMIAVSAAKAQMTWTTCNSTTMEKLGCVYMPGMDKVLAGGKNGVLLLSNDYGNTFSQIPTGSTEDINAIHFFNAQDGIMFLGHKFMHSGDGGLTWNFISQIPGKPKAIHFLNPDTGFVACDLGEAYRTSDGGVTWTVLNTGVTERLEAVYFKQISDGFFGGRNNTSLRTFDQGQTFSLGVVPANGDVKDILFVNTINGYSCGDNGEVLFTNDGGYNWIAQNTPSTEPGMDALHFTDELNGWCSGEGGTIFHTTNGGTSWLNDVSNTMNELNNIFLFDNLHGFAVGDNGTVIRLGSGTTSINESKSRSNIFTVSPNPFSDRFTISANGSVEGDAVLTIGDFTGRIFYKAKVYNSEFNSSLVMHELKKGIYVCRIHSNDHIQTIKLIKN